MQTESAAPEQVDGPLTDDQAAGILEERLGINQPAPENQEMQEPETEGAKNDNTDEAEDDAKEDDAETEDSQEDQNDDAELEKEEVAEKQEEDLPKIGLLKQEDTQEEAEQKEEKQDATKQEESSGDEVTEDAVNMLRFQHTQMSDAIAQTEGLITQAKGGRSMTQIAEESPELFTQISAAQMELDTMRSQLTQIKLQHDEKASQLNESRSTQSKKQAEEMAKAERERILEAIPTWSDEKVLAKDSARISSYLKEKGYPDEAIGKLGTISGHHVLIPILLEAIEGRELKAQAAKGAEKVKDLPKHMTPNKGVQNLSSTRKDAIKQLKRVTSTEDQAKILQGLL